MSGRIMIYGASNIGKTLDSHHALPGAVTILSEPDGLSSVETSLERTPSHVSLVDLKTPFMEAKKVLVEVVAPAIMNGTHNAVIIDSLSTLADRIKAALEMHVTSDPRKLYPLVTEQIKKLIEMIQQLPVWTVLICHERPPATGDKFRKGGPKLPGTSGEAVAYLMSMILRADVEYGGGAPRRVYRCPDLDPMWITKDRWGVTEPVQDLDLRPLLYRRMCPGEELPQFSEKPIRRPVPRSDSPSASPVQSLKSLL